MLIQSVRRMVDGRLKCCGSPFFLKKHFKAEYLLTIVKEPGCNVDDVTGLLRQYSTSIDIVTNIDDELCYRLSVKDKSFYEQMLKELEFRMQLLHLNSFDMSLIKLGDVFHKANIEKPKTNDAEKAELINCIDDHAENTQLLHGFARVRNRFYAVLKTKIYYWKVDRLIYALPIIIGILFNALLFYVHHSTVNNRSKSLEISLDIYDKSVTILDKNDAFSSLMLKLNSSSIFI